MMKMGPDFFEGMEPHETRRVVRNGVREVVGVGIVVSSFALWMGSVTSVPYVDLGPFQQATLDAIAFMEILASAFLVFGKRVVDDALDTLTKIRGGPS